MTSQPPPAVSPSENFTPEEFEIATTELAVALAQGADVNEIRLGLEKEELEPQEIDALITKAEEMAPSIKAHPAFKRQKRNRALKHIVFGSLWCIGGTVVTVMTYQAAEDGGTYVVAYGAIAIGAVQALIGLGMLITSG